MIGSLGSLGSSFLENIDTAVARAGVATPAAAGGLVAKRASSAAAYVGAGMKTQASVSLNSSAAQYVARQAAPAPVAFVQGPAGPQSDGELFGLPRIAVIGGAAVVGLGLVFAVVTKIRRSKKR